MPSSTALSSPPLARTQTRSGNETPAVDQVDGAGGEVGLLDEEAHAARSGGITGPGATAFTCTAGASALARAFVREMTPALETQYGR